MASIVYTSFARDICMAKFNFEVSPTNDQQRHLMLLSSSYTPNKNHSKRSDVIAYEVTGTNYIAGGKYITCVLQNVDGTNNDVEITFPTPVIWPQSTITARYGVVYHARLQTPDNPAQDELVGCVDFLNDVSSSNDTFIAEVSTPLKFQN